MVILGPQTAKAARPSFHTETEDSIQKRRRPTQKNTVLAFAGSDDKMEISTLTKDQKALHIVKSERTSPRRVSRQKLDGSYKVRFARGI